MIRLRALYGLRRTCQLVPSLVLSASTIHLLNLPSEESSDQLRQGVADLQAMSTNHRFAARCIEIIQSLGAKWHIALPEGISSMSSLSYDRLPSPSSSNFWTASIPQHQSFESSGGTGSIVSPHSRQDAAFLQYIHPSQQQQQHHQQQPQQQQQQEPFQSIFDNTAMEMDPGQAQSQFWTPFPAQTMPLPPQAILPSMPSRFSPIDESSSRWPVPNERVRGQAAQFRGDEEAASFPGETQQTEGYGNWRWS